MVNTEKALLEKLQVELIVHLAMKLKTANLDYCGFCDTTKE